MRSGSSKGCSWWGFGRDTQNIRNWSVAAFIFTRWVTRDTRCFIPNAAAILAHCHGSITAAASILDIRHDEVWRQRQVSRDTVREKQVQWTVITLLHGKCGAQKEKKRRYSVAITNVLRNFRAQDSEIESRRKKNYMIVHQQASDEKVRKQGQTENNTDREWILYGK